jgi:SAM-dependent methyltransferase
MFVPLEAQNSFGSAFEETLKEALQEVGILESDHDLSSERLLRRNILPHVVALSDLFNRIHDNPHALEPYWSHHRANARRAAYALYFLPPQIMRLASIFLELHRLGFRFPSDSRNKPKALEIGSGPGTAVSASLLAEAVHGPWLPHEWALLDQDPIWLQFAVSWAHHYRSYLTSTLKGEPGSYLLKTFRKKIHVQQPLLVKTAPRFDLIVLSYVLNEWSQDAVLLSERLLELKAHLKPGGILVIMEPALKKPTRVLLEVRSRLLEDFKVLTPCLGHQACHALKDTEDWCFDTISWWRPPLIRRFDAWLGLDKKQLSMSYLVLQEPSGSGLSALKNPPYYRLVSSAQRVKPDHVAHVCGPDGKYKTRIPPSVAKKPIHGSLLEAVEIKGDRQSARIQKGGILEPLDSAP